MRQNDISGYPKQYLRNRQRYLVGCASFLFFVGAVACVLIYAALYLNGPLAFAALLTACFLWLSWAFYAIIKDEVSVALYFEQKVEGKWIQSEVTARNCVYLDELCAELGIAKLSFFGFEDDWSGKNMVWHDPKTGVETVTALIERLRTNPEVLTESQLILADLERMKSRLREAEAKGVRFCLILHGNSFNGMEIDQRCGYF